VLEQSDDDFDKRLVGGHGVGDRAGLAEVVRGDGVGIAHHLHIHHLQSALDQHASPLP
jgi:hypothetical protein